MFKTTVGINGMMCSMCETHINDAIRKSFDVKKVSSSHTKNQTEIISEEKIDRDKLQSVISQTGYEVTDIQSEPYVKKKFHLFGKNK